MASLNKVMIIGTLTRDPELKHTPKGTAIAQLGLAVNRNYTTDGGEKREEVTFLDVELWGRVAEIAGEYCRKGKPVFIEGRLKLDTWDDKTTGQKRSKIVVVGENLQLLGGKPDGAGSAPPPERPQQRQAPASSRTEADRARLPVRPSSQPAQTRQDLAAEDDIPF